MPDYEILVNMGRTFAAEVFDWKALKAHHLFHKCPANDKMISGKLLAHCRNQVVAFREAIGSPCCFKIGITTNPPLRFSSYVKKNFTCMWVIANSMSLDTVNMLEAGLIALFHKLVGCKNAAESGGEGAQNRKCPTTGPYFVYVTGGRADQACWVG